MQHIETLKELLYKYEVYLKTKILTKEDEDFIKNIYKSKNTDKAIEEFIKIIDCKRIYMNKIKTIEDIFTFKRETKIFQEIYTLYLNNKECALEEALDFIKVLEIPKVTKDMYIYELTSCINLQNEYNKFLNNKEEYLFKTISEWFEYLKNSKFHSNIIEFFIFKDYKILNTFKSIGEIK